MSVGANSNILPNAKKSKDFNDWCIIVNIYYFGYHLLEEGLNLINEIKNNWNSFRLSTYITKNKLNNSRLSSQEFDRKFKNLFLLPSPYEIKNGVRFIRGKNKLVSQKLKIISIDSLNNKLIFSSITECSKTLQIDRTTIKNCLLNGNKYNNYKFIFYNFCPVFQKQGF